MNAVYDLAVSPPTFDFVSFLVAAERERIKRGEDDLRVIIAPGPDNGFRRDDLPPRDPEDRRRMLENIVKPMCKLLPSCSGVEEWLHVSAGFPVGWTLTNRLSHYGLGKMVEAWKAGCFPLRVESEPDDRLITISLRQTYHQTRNSNESAWEALATELLNSGFDVRVIADGEYQNSYERMKLYASARLNLFVNNGPAWVAAFMKDCRCLVFKMESPGAPCVNAEFFARCGFPVGSQIGRDDHRIVWAADDLETLIAETRSELAKPTRIRAFPSTLNTSVQIMIKQAEENLKRDLPLFIEQEQHEGAALLVGGGPSLADTLTNLRFHKERGGVVFALNGTHDYLIERGIVPDFHVVLDARAENVSFVQNPHKKVTYLLALQVHPSLYVALEGYHVIQWMSQFETREQDLALGAKFPDKPLMAVGGGATVGMKSMLLAYLWGFRRLHFYGFDACYRDGENHAYPQPLNANESRIVVEAGGREFVCAPWMAKQAQEMQEWMRTLIPKGCDFYFHGDGLIPWIAAHWQAANASKESINGH